MTLRWIISALLAALLSWLAVTGFETRKLVHRHHPRTAEPLPPDLRGAEDLRLHTEDGEELGAWFLAGDPHKPVVIVLHGHGASRSADRELIAMLHEDGESVFAVTQRAHGDSSGDWSDVGYSSRFDVLAAIAEVTKRAPHSRPVVLGTSMGAAAALFAAKQAGHAVSGYILDAPYVSLERATRLRLEEQLPWPGPSLAYAGLRLWSPLMLDVPIARIAPIEHFADIPADVPLLLIHGEHDETLPAADFQRIVDAAGPRARVVRLDAGHTNGLRVAHDAYRAAVLDFISSNDPRSSR